MSPASFAEVKPVLDRRPGTWPTNKNADYFAARDGDTIVGVAAVSWHPGHARFKSAWVVPERRREGIGHRLFEARLQAARDRGLSTVKATCTEDSLPMFLREGAFVTRRHAGPRTADVTLPLYPGGAEGAAAALRASQTALRARRRPRR